MSGKLRIGIIGCGDFLRLRAADLLSSRQVEVKLLYSPVNSANAERYAEIFGAKAADSPEAIINDPEIDVVCVPFPVSWTVKMKKKQKETQDILSYHTQAAGCSDKARAKASGGRQPIEECGRTGL